MSRLERKKIKKELSKGREETSAAAAFDGSINKLFTFKLKNRLLLVISVSLLLSLVLVAGFFGVRSLFVKEGTVVNTVSSFAEQIQDLSTLATSKAYMKAVVEQEDNALFGKKIDADIPGTKRVTLVILPGEVTAGVDLSKVTENDLSIDEDNKMIRITLPSAEIIQEPSLYFDEAQVYSQEGLLRGSATVEEGYAMAELAQDQIVSEAIEQGLLSSAENQAVAVIDKFMEQLGYDVEIEFKNK